MQGTGDESDCIALPYEGVDACLHGVQMKSNEMKRQGSA